MTMSADAINDLKATYGSKFETALSVKTDAAYNAIITRDSFGSEGYVPFMLGGVGAGQEWTSTRVMREIEEFGIRYTGALYENSVKVKKTTLSDSPAIKAASVAAQMSKSAMAHEEKAVFTVLSANPNGFDGSPLFGSAHAYSAEVGAATYDNDLGGSGTAWYVVNSGAILVATRDGEDYTAQVLGAGSDLEFTEDAIAFGWRARKVIKPGFWANAVKSAQTLNADNLELAIAQFATFVNDKGELLSSAPTHLVVPRSLAAAAKKLLERAFIDGGDSNINLGRLQLIVSDYL